MTKDKAQTRVLVVDDVAINRDILCRRLIKQGYDVTTANDGLQALDLIGIQPFDLVLLDVMMPQMDGYEVLKLMKANPQVRHIPVIMISALDQLDSVVRCIELGAEDYLPKPFNPVLLKARIDACLEKKFFRDQEQAFLEQIQEEQAKSERLLLNIMPKAIAERLKQGEMTIADYFPDVTVMFADIVGFSQWSSLSSPSALVGLLNQIFSTFDDLTDKYGLEKIKTIGDAYMVVGGLPEPRADHATAVANMALDMLVAIGNFYSPIGDNLQMRIGIHSGPVEAGVIGLRKFTYDLWGDTVNVASRMESHSLPGCIQVSAATRSLLGDKYLFEERGTIEIKGKGEMTTYFLLGVEGR
ncbi:MAG: hypothetical protein Fur0025_04500 [Oscillatoriaceae cyanobacterium]